ncbi:MAG: hypothetical protein ABSB50_19275 [Terracidiphilus sp.]|jgi:hypothetical protein
MKTAFRLAICWIAFVVAFMLGGFIDGALHLRAGALPGGASPQSFFLAQLFAGLVLVIGLWPLARSLAAPPVLRAAAFVAFLLFALGVNGIIEARRFTNFLDAGIAPAVVFYLCVAAILGTSTGLLFGSSGRPAGLPHRTWPAWSWRVLCAWLGWPAVYLFFGTCIAPIVTPYYSAGVAGLRIPTLGVVITTQLVRSVLFLATSLVFVALWKGSRRGLWFTLGLAHAFTIGLYGIVGATFLPTVLRVTHTIEMTCDAFAYAGLLVLFFTAPAVAKASTEPLPQDPDSLPHPLPL